MYAADDYDAPADKAEFDFAGRHRAPRNAHA
jgi:hypothetical protein